MKTSMGVALFGLTLLLVGCSTNPREVPAASAAHSNSLHACLRRPPASTTRATQS